MAFTTNPNSVPGRVLRYPENVAKPPFDKWIRFDAMRGRHILKRHTTVETGIPADRLASVVLYLSESTMKTALGVRWETAELGELVGAALDVLGPAAGTLAASSTKETAKAAFKSGIGSLAANVASQGMSTMMAIAAIDVLSDWAPSSMNALQAAFGTRINPRTEVFFDTVAYREFQMEFALIPRNHDEAKSIDSIIEFFHFYMLPKYHLATTDFLIGYPYEFNVGIYQGTDASTSKIRSIGQIGRSVITGVTVDHAAGGKTAFVQNAGNPADIYPAATNLTLAFQEVRLLDRSDFGTAYGVDTLRRTGDNRWPER